MGELKTGTELLAAARIENDALEATVVGEIDLHNSPDLRVGLLELLKDHPCKRLVLDIKQVPYMDSSAVAVLVELLQKMRKTGGKVVLVSPQPRVRGLLEIARLDTIFEVVDG